MKLLSVASMAILAGVAAAKRNVYMCPGPNWTGPCTLFGFDNGECMDISFWDTLGSIGPDEGLVCSMFVEPGNCYMTTGNFNSGGFVSPGIADMTTWQMGSGEKWPGYWFSNAKTVQCLYQ